MNILILSWEYPPRNVGGISTHVYNLSHSLNKLGHNVTVLTCSHGDSPQSEDDNGVMVYRATPLDIPVYNFTDWVNHLNYAMIDQCIRLFSEGKKFDIVHAHDWLVAYTGKVIKDTYNLPLVTTIHSTEHGRNNGIYTDLQKYISSVENFLINESNSIICSSESMKAHITSVFNYEGGNLVVIPNTLDIQTQENENMEVGELTGEIYKSLVPAKKKTAAKRESKKTVSKEADSNKQEVAVAEVKKTRKSTKKKTETI